MASINLTARDIDLIGRVVDTEVPRSIARKNLAEYNRMVGAVVDTITNRLATGRYGKTIQEVLDQRRAFSKITGPARLNPYGSVTKAPKATFTAQNAVDNHIKGRIAGVPSIIGGALDYANPNFTDRKNLRGWVQPMIDAGAKMLGIGNAKHYHGLAPGNFPAPPTDISGPPGFAPHRGPPGAYNVSSPMRPDEANAAGPKGRFSLDPNFSAPVGKVTRGTLSAPTLGAQRTRSTTVPSLDANKDVFGGLQRPGTDTTGNFPGMSVPRDTASPRTMATTLGGINSVVGGLANAPVNRTTPKVDRLAFDPITRTTPKVDRLQQTYTASIAPAAIYDDPRALAYAQNMTPQPVDAVLPGAITEDVLPQTLAQPKRVQRVRQPLQITVRSPRRQTVTAPSMPGGTLGGISAQDRFSVGTGVQGITSAMGGIRGATGFSRSTPGVSVTSRGPTLGTITHNERYQTDTFRDANNNVTGVHLSPGQLGRTLGSIFGGSKSTGSGKSSGSSSGKSGSGKSGGARGAAGGGLGQSQRSL